jgi:hypothetical protein
MSVFSYRRDFKPFGLKLITVFRDAVYGFMPHLESNNTIVMIKSTNFGRDMSPKTRLPKRS